MTDTEQHNIAVAIEQLSAGNTEAMRTMLVRSWLEHTDHNLDMPHATKDSRIRHSWAAKCSREMSYSILGREPSEPFDAASLWVFRLGHLGQYEWDRALKSLVPLIDVGIEVKRANPDVFGSATLDGLITFPDGSTQIVEVKTINGFGFKGVVGLKGEAGPRHSAKVQAALNAHAQGLETTNHGAWLIYVALENIGIPEAERRGVAPLGRFMHVFYYPQDECERLAGPEMDRMRMILALTDEGQVVPRMIPDPQIPDGAVITDPKKGTWQLRNEAGEVLDVGSTWHCAYCNQRSRCLEDGE